MQTGCVRKSTVLKKDYDLRPARRALNTSFKSLHSINPSRARPPSLSLTLVQAGWHRGRRYIVNASNTVTSKPDLEPLSTEQMELPLLFSSSFDGGNGILQGVEKNADQTVVNVEIAKEPYSDKDKREHYQWFYFRISNVAIDSSLQVNLTNAGGASYSFGYPDYKAVCSYDRSDWFRIQDTNYDKESGILCMNIPKPAHPMLYIAYFAPYSLERHMALVSKSSVHPRCSHVSIGQTLDGFDMDLLIIKGGAGCDKKDANMSSALLPSKKKKIWVIARQHPGETMAEYFMEGFIDRLLNDDDPQTRELLKECDVYTVPNMCPDGSRRGHLRTNAIGVNLNREWKETNPERCPEVYCVLKTMDQVGCDCMIDVHGDEALPYNFVSGMEGIPSWDQTLEMLQMRFITSYCTASPDFQCKYGYGRDKPGKANLAIGSNGVAERFKCLGLTLEMPFKDTADSPMPAQGWSPTRSKILGETLVQPLLAVAPFIKQEE